MDLIKKYKAIFLIVLPLAILVLIRASGTNHFMTDARKLAEPSFSRTNIVTSEISGQLNGEKLIIFLGKDAVKPDLPVSARKTIPADSILNKENLRLLRNHNGPVLLCASETSVSVRIWMLLSQMGIENLYIVSKDPEPEALKYEFRPDTTARPEL
jgi:hypothetical protein